MTCLRSIDCLRIGHTVKNKKNRKNLKLINLFRDQILKSERFGQMKRMEKSSITRKALEIPVIVEDNPLGRPRRRWEDNIRMDRYQCG